MFYLLHGEDEFTSREQLKTLRRQGQFDFNQDIYTQSIRMEFLHFVRGDIKFTSLEDLTTQLGRDKEAVLGLLS